MIDMTPGRMPLPATHWSKAEAAMRALRGALLSYWYATLRDTPAATIAAAGASFWVNILDEAVFLDAHGDPYQRVRGRDRRGQVVMGLELIRNCETHSHETFNDLLVQPMTFGVPLTVGQVMRSVYAWADYDDLPKSYRELPATASTVRQQRARGEAQDGYRRAVQGRLVTETPVRRHGVLPIS